jgi:hypothetical protein
MRAGETVAAATSELVAVSVPLRVSRPVPVSTSEPAIVSGPTVSSLLASRSTPEALTVTEAPSGTWLSASQRTTSGGRVSPLRALSPTARLPAKALTPLDLDSTSSPALTWVGPV